MGKMRIYELAKELGIENKEVLAKCHELGIKGKSSHSHSLESDESDQIRRAVIRSALGSGEGTVIASTSSSSAKDLKSGEVLVEHRRGNIIRRRRQTAEEEAEELARLNSNQSNSNQSKNVAQDSEVSPDVILHDQRSQLSHSEVQSESREEENRDILHIGLNGTHESLVTEQIGTANESDINEPEQLEHIAPKDTPKQIEGQSVEAQPSTELEAHNPEAHSEVQPEQEAVIAAKVEEPKVEVAPRRVLVGGPRVLGKIELPQKRVIPVAAVASRDGSAARAEPLSVESDADKRKGLKDKKGKKREFNRVDLVDYDSELGRRAARKKVALQRTRTDDSLPGYAQGTDPSKAVKPGKRELTISEAITVGELARQMSLKSAEVIAKLIQLGVLATINQTIDFDTASIVAAELGFEVKAATSEEAKLVEAEVPEDQTKLILRAPVVTVMGHVDHGKTSLLDAIRQTSVASREHGGITQHIGAYKVTLDDNKSITFIDTPGHEAFTEMRARGAKVTDIVILVVAADDGVMPQTREAIDHAKAALVPIVVAINKIDKPGVNLDRIKGQLADLGLNPEDWGGDTMYFPVSALKGTGVKEMLEGVLLQADVKELKANPDRKAKGVIIEARQDKRKGMVATVLVQSGTLKVGDAFAVGCEYGRVRSMSDQNGDRMEQAGPSTPVEITGLTGLPFAGDEFAVVENDATARQLAAIRTEKKRKLSSIGAGAAVSFEQFTKMSQGKGAQELNVIIKSDMQGSAEAVRAAVEKLATDQVKVRIIHTSVGAITETDVQLAIASRAVIVGFGVRAEQRAQTIAQQSGVQIRFYNVIYELVDDMQKAMSGMLAPIKQENQLGRAEVRNTFSVPKLGVIAGCFVTSGVIKRGAQVRLLRDNRVIYEGKMGSLRRFKDDVKEVQENFECGISIERFNDIKVSDVIEVFEIIEVAATLN